MKLPQESKDRIRASIIGAFAADAHALGSHWVYDPKEIKSQFDSNKIKQLNAPLSGFHSGKTAGDQTHYGTQLLASLQYLASKRSFALAEWFESWKKSVSTGRDYVDHSSKTVLGNIASGRAVGPDASSDATDGASLVRFLPLLAISLDEDVVGETARAQTESIYRPHMATQATELFARMMFHVVHANEVPSFALLELLPKFPAVKDLIQKGLDSGKSKAEDSNAAASFKITCDLSSGLPLIAHFIAKYESDPSGYENALIGNAYVGGDSASRAIVIGATLAAKSGSSAIPAAWTNGLHAAVEIDAATNLLLS
eukprot:TRINITY_DN3378_c0_g1_i2.p1 TRINITY_DN3378_c0_g1~~TRINITY_DN3378_c0_g1_i2.p1  ORF type:complete len:313 (+),score=138.30 TRINITY_DN3378_c0_g1_i2:286-1224(+)